MTHSDMPYNQLNRLLSTEVVSKILNRYGIENAINDINIYRKALVHRSYCTRKNENFINGNLQCPANCIPLQEESNERLEFLGDAIINMIIAKYLYDRFPDENEGFLTKLRTKLVNGNMLAELCKLLELQTFILISKQIEENCGRSNKKILEDCFEAFIGAMFLDFESDNQGGYIMVERWLIQFIEENVDFPDLMISNTNYKDTLLKYFQHNYNFIPRFFELSSHNTSTGKTYHVCVKDKNDVVISTGIGNSKKAAENDCAKNALVHYGVYSL